MLAARRVSELRASLNTSLEPHIAERLTTGTGIAGAPGFKVQRVVLAAILCLAVCLRFTGIDHHVRRGSPTQDEQNNIVLPILDMWSKPTANPGVRIGYAGFFNYIAFLPVGIGHRWAGVAGAYVAGRGLVGLFSVLSVFLLYRLGRELVGEWPALFAASLLAVSRGEVGHSHYITPDVVVVSGTLGVLLLCARRPLDVTRAVAAGALCGLCVAIKYTGLLALPGLLATLVVQRFPRKPAMAALLATSAAFAAAAPYAILRASSPVVGTGLEFALRDYYSAGGYAATTARNPEYANPVAAEIVGYLSQNLGPAGLGLAALSVVLFRPLAGLISGLTVVAFSVMVILPAHLVYPRHLLVPSAILALLAACGFRGLLQRLKSPRRRAAVAVVASVAVFAPPARNSLSLAAGYLRPSSVDLAASWMEANIPRHALVATGLPRFVLDRDRFEVRSWVPLCPPSVLRHYDLVVIPYDQLPDLGLRRFSTYRLFDDGSGPVAVVTSELPSLKRVVPTTTAASHQADHSAGPWLGTSSWRSPGGGAWISGEWQSPLMIERVEVISDEVAGLRPQWLELEGQVDPGGPWKKLDVWPLRPGKLSRQAADSPLGQIYVLAPPLKLAGLRVSGRDPVAWGVGKVTVLAHDRPN